MTTPPPEHRPTQDRPAKDRSYELALAVDPATSDDARLVFIGQIRSPWRRQRCPKNLREAREWGGGGEARLNPAYRPGLQGLRCGEPVLLLYWLDHDRRHLIVQQPRHLDAPRGVFALRSPVRPNPIAVAVVTITALDIAAGVVAIDAIDCFDGTPLLDIKPWLRQVDIPPPP